MTTLNMDPLYDWMTERQAIYERRASGAPKPWTSDVILRDYRFCNVFRELDTVTIWVRENIREPYADHPNLWFMLCLARYINHPATLQEMMDRGHWPVMSLVDWDWRLAARVIDDRIARGEQAYTGAYMIRAESDKKVNWYSWTKAEYICGIVLGTLIDCRGNIEPRLVSRGYTLQKAHALLTQFYGWGPFMAYEVVTDLRHTRYLCDAPDIMTWANAGPGALRGLNRLMGRDKNAPLSQERANTLMEELLVSLSERMPEGFPELEMRDIEHSLCETDKYLRVLYGEGRPRAKYNGVK